MSSLGEVELAVDACARGGCEAMALLHCTSEYPAPAEESNLRAIDTMRRCFGVPVGFSDHTKGILVSVMAVALGACIIEKHFTLDRDLPGPDHSASLEPAELRSLVQGVRMAEQALGTGIKVVSASERPNKILMQKSIVAVRDIAAGEVLTSESLTAKRPANGVPPVMLPMLIGARARRAIQRDEAITLAALEFPA
jgi:sialic acid synthase SpsE